MLQVPPEDVAHLELPAPPISLWQKCIPLAIVFFCASFNLVRCRPACTLRCQIQQIFCSLTHTTCKLCTVPEPYRRSTLVDHLLMGGSALQTILQNLKDAIVVTAAGAEALPFLASFCVLPASLLFFFAYGATAAPRTLPLILSTRFDIEQPPDYGSFML